MEFGLMAALAALTAVVLRLHRRLCQLEEQLADHRQSLSAAEEVLRDHSRWEQEAAKSERLFREGLQNILNYGVK